MAPGQHLHYVVKIRKEDLGFQAKYLKYAFSDKTNIEQLMHEIYPEFGWKQYRYDGESFVFKIDFTNELNKQQIVEHFLSSEIQEKFSITSDLPLNLNKKELFS